MCLPPPAAPTITSPASGSTDTTTAEPAIAGTGVSGDTVTVSIDGTQVGTAPVSQQRLELHAGFALEQRQPHGRRDPSRFGRAQLDRRPPTRSPSMCRPPPAAPTITNPASGSTYSTTAEPAIAGTGVSGDTVTVSIDGTQVATTAPVLHSAWSFTPTGP